MNNDNYLSNAGVLIWPEHDDVITGVAHNGEVSEPVYRIGCTLYRINPVGTYALVWNGKKWMENQRLTNAAVRLNGDIVK